MYFIKPPPIRRKGKKIPRWGGVCLSLLLLSSLLKAPLYAADLSAPPEDTDYRAGTPAEASPGEMTPGEEPPEEAATPPTEESLPYTDDGTEEPESSEADTPPKTGEESGVLDVHAHIFGEGPVFAGVGKILFDGEYLTVTAATSELGDLYHLSFNTPEPGVLIFLFYSDRPLPEGDALLFRVFFRSTAAEERQFTILLTEMTASNGTEDLTAEDISFDITVAPGQPLPPQDSAPATAPGTSSPPESGTDVPGTDTKDTESKDTDRPHTADTGVTDSQGTDDETSHGGSGGSGIATVLLLIVLITVPILVITYVAFVLISKKKQQKGPKK